MYALRVSLFKRFRVQYRDRVLTDQLAQKSQELFCLLLINHDQPHTRETLAGLLWNNGSTENSKRYLRQTLWQLQSTLDSIQLPEKSLVMVDGDWIYANIAEKIWLDVYEFEKAYALAQGIDGRELDEAQIDALRAAVQLYDGHLLENWYQDWCIFERERLQNIYLAMLDKLIGYCESKQEYEEGIAYGMQLLKCDWAHERTYRRLMRIYYFAGDRTSSLRQYQRCNRVLQEELGVEPSRRTKDLHWQIQTEQFNEDAQRPGTPSLPKPLKPPDTLARLLNLSQTLAQVQRQLEREIEAVRQDCT